MPFKPGVSGNPSGRPKGCLNRSTREILRYRKLALRELLRHVRKGDLTALSLLLARTHPAIRPVAPTIRVKASTKNLGMFGRKVLQRVAAGRVSPDTAASVLAALNSQATLLQHTDLLARIEALEADTRAPDLPTLQRRKYG